MEIKPGDRVKVKSSTLPHAHDVSSDDTGVVLSFEPLRNKQVRVLWSNDGRSSLHYPFELEIVDRSALDESFLLGVLERLLAAG